MHLGVGFGRFVRTESRMGFHSVRWRYLQKGGLEVSLTSDPMMKVRDT